MITVVMTTSEDEKFPGEAILSVDTRHFWTSTGLYPQEIIIQLNPANSFKTVRIVSTNIRQLVIEGCETQNVGNFVKIGETEIGNNRGGLQRESVNINQPRPFSFIKVIVLSGWDHFVSIHSLHLE